MESSRPRVVIDNDDVKIVFDDPPKTTEKALAALKRGLPVSHKMNRKERRAAASAERRRK